MSNASPAPDPEDNVSPPTTPRQEDPTALLEQVLAWLEAAAEDRTALAGLDEDQRCRLVRAAAAVSRPNRRQRRMLSRARRARAAAKCRERDEEALGRTTIRRQRAAAVFPTPAALQAPPASEQAPEIAPVFVHEPRCCYTCKASFTELHGHYDALCPECAAFNWRKREQTADLSGRVALVTGGRVKIGYQVVIKLLRAGARVVMTTRFPRDAAGRFAREADAATWSHRLAVHGLDLRHTPSVETLCRHLNEHEQRLDFLINNACQTVRRPPGFYGHLLEAEAAPVASLPESARALLVEHEALMSVDSRSALSGGAQASAGLSQIPLLLGDLERGQHLFPAGQLDADLQQVDLRDTNSWRMRLDVVPTVELLEVHLVNAVAPFVLAARLKPLMTATPERDKHVVNVSAMEGSFSRGLKTDKHPHTNMAKAALNMLTRTSAQDYVRSGIHINSVDTGWITDEDPVDIAEHKRDQLGFHPPLDHVDAAARILDPVFTSFLTGKHVWGCFLKDYAATTW